MTKEVKAWMFLTFDNKTILDGFTHSTDIFFKKPPKRRNPFTQEVNWKPTQVIVTFPLPQ